MFYAKYDSTWLNFVKVFSLFNYYLPFEEGDVLHLDKLEFLRPTMRLVTFKFGCNLPKGNGEDVKSLQITFQRDRRKDGQRTTEVNFHLYIPSDVRSTSFGPFA